MDDLEQFEVLGLVSKVTSEINNYMGISDKTIAESVRAPETAWFDLPEKVARLRGPRCRHLLPLQSPHRLPRLLRTLG